MEDKRTETEGGKWGGEKNVYFLASLLDEGVQEERGCKKKKKKHRRRR